MVAKDDLIVWMDLEMTGLEPATDRIIEVAVLVTDGQLQTVAEGPSLVIHQPDAVLDAMDEWNTKHHGASGLTQRVKESSISESDAEQQILEFLRTHCAERTAPLAGNSIHQDRRFIRKYMPGLDSFLHYRQIDVSTIKELVRRWYPAVHKKLPRKNDTHRALDDILESVTELQHYRAQVFRATEEPDSSA